MKVLICKDILGNKLISSSTLQESDNIVYGIIENAPVIENKVNMIGRYELDENGQLVVVYEPKPKTEIDLINEKLDQILGTTKSVQEDNLINMDMIISNDEKLDIINNKIQ